MREDLNLRGTQYNWLSSIFYFGFLAWAFPTNFLMQRLPIGISALEQSRDPRPNQNPRKISWCKHLHVVGCYLQLELLDHYSCKTRGVFLMLQAACNSFETLSVLRALGGAAEACSDPAFLLITSMWYTRREQPVRIGLWYTANGIGIALGGLLGYGIGHLRGALPSWKYEFLVMYVSYAETGISVTDSSTVVLFVLHGVSLCSSSFPIRLLLPAVLPSESVGLPSTG